MRRGDIDPEDPRGVLAEDLVLCFGCELRVTVLSGKFFGYREGLEGLDLPVIGPPAANGVERLQRSMTVPETIDQCFF
jgi:hypothetical protein